MDDIVNVGVYLEFDLLNDVTLVEANDAFIDVIFESEVSSRKERDDILYLGYGEIDGFVRFSSEGKASVELIIANCSTKEVYHNINEFYNVLKNIVVGESKHSVGIKKIMKLTSCNVNTEYFKMVEKDKFDIVAFNNGLMKIFTNNILKVRLYKKCEAHGC